MAEVNDDMFNESIKYLKSPTKFLKNMVSTLEYDTCHATTEYDAEKCQQDCLRLEKSNFAGNCSRKGGLYKCCIRSEEKQEQNEGNLSYPEVFKQDGLL